jgi:hypothetical protein
MPKKSQINEYSDVSLQQEYAETWVVGVCGNHVYLGGGGRVRTLSTKGFWLNSSQLNWSH